MFNFIQDEESEKEIKNNNELLNDLKDIEEKEIIKIKNDLYDFAKLILEYYYFNNTKKENLTLYENDNYIIKEENSFNINIYKKIKIKKLFKSKIDYTQVLSINSFHFKWSARVIIQSFNVDLIQEAYDSIYSDICFKYKQQLRNKINGKTEEVEYLKLLHFKE